MADMQTRQRILDAALDLFGARGVDAVSLDVIARDVGVRKQTLLYWFVSKDDLINAVFEHAAAELVHVIGAAVRSVDASPLGRIDEVIKAVFRPAVRRPAILGLIRELNRLPAAQVDRLRVQVQPLIDSCFDWMKLQMDKGELRRADPGLVMALAYSTVAGIATEPVALDAVGWQPNAVGLRHLRDELRAFLQASLRPQH